MWSVSVIFIILLWWLFQFDRDTSCFHWYILLHIKLWNWLFFCYGWICRVVLHDNLLMFFFQFHPTCRPPPALSHSQGSYKRLSQIVTFLATKNLFTYDFWICWIVNHYFFSTWLWIQMNRVELSSPHSTHGFSTCSPFPVCLFYYSPRLEKCRGMETCHCLTCWLV